MTLCPLCRALPRFALRVDAFKKDPDPAEGEKLFSAACWIIAALERTRPCAAHSRTLRRAKRLTETLAGLIEERELTTTPTAAMASEATARKEIR
jgi:hypothetical protein